MKDVISNEYGHCHYCVCQFDNCAMIYNLYIEKEHRRKGHATDFIQKQLIKLEQLNMLEILKL